MEKNFEVLEIGGYYKDRSEDIWQILSREGKYYIGGKWQGKYTYRTRDFLMDGKYHPGKDTKYDLIEKINA